MAGRLAADLSRRPRLRLQVEHGLDARHARVLLEGADPPPLPPPRADLLDGLRLERELRPAALARRGRARQAARCSGRCPATAGSASPTCAPSTATCGRTPASSCSSWAASSGRRRSGASRPGRSTGTCSTRPTTPACRRSSATSTAIYAEEPALWELDHSHEGFVWLEPNAANENVLAFVRRSEDGKRCARRRLQLLAGRARGLADRPAHGGQVARGAEHRLALLRRLATSATASGSRPRRCRGTSSR